MFIGNIQTDWKYLNSMVITIDLLVLDIVHFHKYLNLMAIIIVLNKKLW
jgi:hypothetical protein